MLKVCSHSWNSQKSRWHSCCWNKSLLKEGNTWSHNLRIVFSCSSLIDSQIWSIGNLCSCHILCIWGVGGGGIDCFFGGSSGVDCLLSGKHKHMCTREVLKVLEVFIISMLAIISANSALFTVLARWTILIILWQCTISVWLQQYGK